MTPWLPSALAYVASWLDFQRRLHDQPGVAIAVANGGEIALEAAFGSADLVTGEALTPRHGFRIASHSKSFTGAGILRLVEDGRLRLDDRVGSFIDGLHPEIAAVTIGQVLSNSAGLTRDGPDNGQFFDRKPYCDRAELLDDLAEPPVFPASQRFKYSNHGFGLLGLVIESVTGLSYSEWITDEVVAKVGLTETKADIELWGHRPMAKGHSGTQPLGYRVVIPGDNPGRAMVSAAGFVATAADVARYFAQLSPQAETSILTPLSRREMTRRLWPDDEASLGRHYGLGTISGGEGAWRWFGHSGGFQGFITRTCVFPAQDLTVSVLTNAIDGLAHPWLDGVVHILKTFSERGAPPAGTEDWNRRGWCIWGAGDLVPVSDRVLIANPALFTPFLDAGEITLDAPDRGHITRASGFNSPGEPARLVRDETGAAQSVWLGGGRFIGEEDMKVEMLARYVEKAAG
ncbi:beta-lactamase family protein [Bosea sp. SSUT16]|jgi:CubicO group peptidase (beta-lactamase class C family)|uniref:Beta-lactamase family protein n=1 Tax=Bosea spartocytisi TaxID=2773451 RepID=A0A927I1Q4_9HYPH|nr:serine hydrolase domain-containing protein [Bosea spartocytisi]MBD3848699.1 beta-lactamase family protein [Bosea spartocytisi]MCT4471731.1 beta-lactamase family protein [Bosea spartocytisi]